MIDSSKRLGGGGGGDVKVNAVLSRSFITYTYSCINNYVMGTGLVAVAAAAVDSKVQRICRHSVVVVARRRIVNGRDLIRNLGESDWRSIV